MRGYWTYRHTAVASLTLCLAFIWVAFASPHLTIWLGGGRTHFLLLSFIGTVLILSVFYFYIVSYDKWRQQVLAADEINGSGHFKGAFWSVVVNGDQIEVWGPFLHERGNLSKVHRIAAACNSRGHCDVTLCFHNSNWERRDKEISIVLNAFSLPEALALLRVIREKTPQAEVSPHFIEMVEEGKGLT